jgi:nucleotide-binding universal stress UspA family protein
VLAATSGAPTFRSMADTNGHRPVLIAYDGSDQAKAAIREAGRQLGPGREGIVLSVWEPLSAIALGAPPPYDTPELEESVEADARKVAEQGAELAESVGFAAKAMTERGSPIWNSLVQAADDHDVDLVVMGSHGRTGISLILLGSVASAVARHTDRPVLIVHSKSD